MKISLDSKDLLQLHLEIDRANAARDAAIREAEELRGIVETYGMVVLDRDRSRGVVRLQLEVTEELVAYATGGSMLVFQAALRKCADQWQEWFNTKRGHLNP
jgi:hypothetical protein